MTSYARRGGVEQVILISGGAGNPLILAGTVDPSAGGGVAAPEGSLYQRYGAGAGEVWMKMGAADTTWFELEAESITGGIYTSGGVTAQTGITGTPTKVTGFASAYGNPLYVTEDHANDKLILASTVSGRVLVFFSMSFSGTASGIFTFQAYNAAGSVIPGCACQRAIGTGGDVGSAGFTGFWTAVASDSIEIRVSSSVGGPGGEITPVYASLIVHKT